MTSPDLPTLCERLEEQAAALECGAEMEGHIVTAGQPVLDAWTADPDSKSNDNARRVRAICDARSSRERFLKEAADLRSAASTIRELEEAVGILNAMVSQHAASDDELMAENAKLLSERDAAREALTSIGRLARRGDGSRMFDDCIKDLMLIDDITRKALESSNG